MFANKNVVPFCLMCTTLSFEKSYFGQIRKLVGRRLLKVPGTRIVVENENGEFLLQLRADCGKWGLLSGLPEEKEGIVDTAEREVQEETGLRPTLLVPRGFACSPESEVFTYPNGDVIQNYALLFHCKDWEGELSSRNSETLDLKFFNVDQLPTMLPNHAITVEGFLKYRKKGQFQII